MASWSNITLTMRTRSSIIRAVRPVALALISRRSPATRTWTTSPLASHVERLNLSLRMGMRRFTRLTNAFSKKVENHKAAVALHFMHYNFARIHQTLRVTPAMEAGVSDHVWSIEEIVGLLDQRRPSV
jgi:hypothetical protein